MKNGDSSQLIDESPFLEPFYLGYPSLNLSFNLLFHILLIYADTAVHPSDR